MESPSLGAIVCSPTATNNNGNLLPGPLFVICKSIRLQAHLGIDFGRFVCVGEDAKTV